VFISVENGDMMSYHMEIELRDILILFR
jgi:hypothetical protein